MLQSAPIRMPVRRRHPHAVRQLQQDQGGLALLLWAFGMFFILAFLAIVVETGFSVIQRRDLQNSADAAALAGAQTILLNPGAEVSEAQAVAAQNVSGLVTNQATLVTATRVRVRVAKNAESLFEPTHWLSFGEPLVSATATARVASPSLPGPGVVPLGIEFDGGPEGGIDHELATFLGLGSPAPGDANWAAWSPPNHMFTLKLGEDAENSANTGPLAVDGSGANHLRDGLIFGSSSGLESTEPSQGGQLTGPVRQGLKVRLQAAWANGCLDWTAVQPPLGGSRWACGPIQAGEDHPTGVQATAVILLPVIAEDWLGQPGNQPALPVYSVPVEGGVQYILAYFWVDMNATFIAPKLLGGNWQCLSETGALCDIVGHFMFDVPVTLALLDRGDGGLVECSEFATFCGVQLTD